MVNSETFLPKHGSVKVSPRGWGSFGTNARLNNTTIAESLSLAREGLTCIILSDSYETYKRRIHSNVHVLIKCEMELGLKRSYYAPVN